MKNFDVSGHRPSLLPEDKEWTLVWSDEFDGNSLDRSKWDFANIFGENVRLLSVKEALRYAETAR